MSLVRTSLFVGAQVLDADDGIPVPLKHVHIQFAHCYKHQEGWQEVLARFAAGGGTLYDMEFLEDENRRRIAAFGYHAGYAGAAIAIENWAWQLEHGPETPLPAKEHYNTESDLLKELSGKMEQGLLRNSGAFPQVLVIGALGRCGKGALDLCRAVGVPEDNLLKWDMAETAKGGPFDSIRESDIFINCIYLDKPIPKFVTETFLKENPSSRKLAVVCDVSCDTTNPNNPIPFCNKPTYFDKPTITLREFSNPPLSYITIDHLPSLLPRGQSIFLLQLVSAHFILEASEAFSAALLASLLELPKRSEALVWKNAEQLFKSKVATLPVELQQARSS